MNPLYLIDFYKVGHVSQYPKGTTKVYANWTPRTSRIPGADHIVNFGLQYFIKSILQHEWEKNFFKRSLSAILNNYREVMHATLGVVNPRTDHIEALHKLGYLPIEIYALPEGEDVPLKVPVLVITNTVDHAFWLPNYLETIISNILWKMQTSATTAQQYRQLFKRYAIQAHETDFSFIDWQGHDFSMRGMSGREDAVLSGMGHLLSFNGTDTIPAILAAKEFYSAPLSCGGSVPATEHSVMCAGGCDSELETFRRLIEDVYPSGIVSIVSDTWDLWKVLNDYIPQLKDKILARDGKIVIRPDSGDPVLIMTGDKNAKEGSSQNLGALALLAKALGTTTAPNELRKIVKGGLIYGDSITLDRADQILSRTIAQGYSPYNMVFGIGSFTYEYVTRDTYGFAMKATAVEQDGVLVDIFKKPVTDDGGKTSLKGIPCVYEQIAAPSERPHYYVRDGRQPSDLDTCAFRKVFLDGTLLVEETFDTIKERVRR